MLMLSKDDGGSGTGTLKEQLTAAEKDRDKFKTQADQAAKDLKAEQDAHASTKASLEKAEKDRDDFEARADKAEEDLKAEQDAHAKLKKEQKNAGDKAKEQLARNGIKPSAKDTPENLNPDAGDPAALWQEYAQADSTKQAQMRAKHGVKLEEAAEAFDKAQKEGR